MATIKPNDAVPPYEPRVGSQGRSDGGSFGEGIGRDAWSNQSSDNIADAYTSSTTGSEAGGLNTVAQNDPASLRQQPHDTSDPAFLDDNWDSDQFWYTDDPTTPILEAKENDRTVGQDTIKVPVTQTSFGERSVTGANVKQETGVFNFHGDIEDVQRMLNIFSLSHGLGGYYNRLQTFMSSLARYPKRNADINREQVGLTFITRPRLCLQSSNLRGNRIMTPLDTLNQNSMAFAIRCLLDSNFGKANMNRHMSLVKACPLFDWQNPFLTPLCNSIISFSGSPDMSLQSDTTQGGYFQEAQSYALGADNFRTGNYTITMDFVDSVNSPIMAIFLYWMEYMRCVTRGTMSAYADDVDAQRLNYTVSIYRFMLDPTRRYITRYAKYTGCYPESLPIGGPFNFSGDDIYSDVSKVSISFRCNVVEYMDYAILQDFRRLMKRYCSDIDSEDQPTLPNDPVLNYRGLPYIVSDTNGFRLEWRAHAAPAFGNTEIAFPDQLYMAHLAEQIRSDPGYSDLVAFFHPGVHSTATSGETPGSLREFINKAFRKKSGSMTMDPI